MARSDYVDDATAGAIQQWLEADLAERRARFVEAQITVLGVGVPVPDATLWTRGVTSSGAVTEYVESDDASMIAMSMLESWWSDVPPRLDGTAATLTLREEILEQLTAPSQVPPLGAS